MLFIPPEVLEQILQFCDKQTLCSTSLVAHRFLDPSQRQLFSELHFRWLPVEEQRHMCSILSQSPHRLANHVRVFSLGLDPEFSLLPPTILQSLTNLTALHLSWEGLLWEASDTDTQEIVKTAIGLPTLRVISVIGLGFVAIGTLLSVLNSLGPNLQSMSFIAMFQKDSMLTNYNTNSDLQVVRRGISALHLGQNVPNGLWSWLQTTINFSAIQVLGLALNNRESECQTILDAAVNIQELNINAHRMSNYSNIHLNHASQLATLTLNCRIEDDGDDDEKLVFNPLAEFCAIVRRTRPLHKLTSLELIIQYACNSPLSHFHQPGADVNRLLVEPVLVGVKSVLVVLDWTWGTPENPADLYDKDGFHEYFRAFIERGGQLRFGA
ncbi:hypothetical protein MIND_00676400 [Mycena indigotica]|uniref:F-box domain-containing protein n=1 Tax=Mycena indigotica TaxID=2126181 RepID=A0A8H6SMU0_9AGAR|nr:uncharacterized protein MIND_00676400 [Mycena indigotica]KAF7301122.1 hypothetical protein MIND_00676400 [Mycena indigotica]